MNARILCPGPSLATYQPGEFRGTTIGVNRAATAFACDVWAALDWPLVVQQSPLVIGSPILLTSTASIESLRRRMIWRGAIQNCDVFAYCLRTYANARTYTMNMACGYAYSAGFTDIAIYGADWAGTLDFDGAKAGEKRDQDRWQREQELFGHMAEEMATHGVKVSRVNNGHS